MHKVVFPDQGVVELVPMDRRELGPGDVRIESLVSLISTGTEGICFLRLYDPDTHYDRWVKPGMATGYCMVGRISEVGTDVHDRQVGQLVASRVVHATENVIDARLAFLIPDGIEPSQATWFALAMVGLMGARAGDFKLGDDILIVGAGPIGQIELRWAVAAGARRAVILDPVAMRLGIAEKGGASASIQSTAGEAKEAVQAAFGGTLPAKVVDTTGHPAVFEKCLELVADRGTLVLLGDTGRPHEQRLTPDVVLRGIRIVGAHITHETEFWHEEACAQFFFDLVRRGRFSLDGMNTHRFGPSQCKEAYGLIEHARDSTMGILFDWTKP